VLGLITAQRTGRAGVQRLQSTDPTDERGGVAPSALARQLSIISGFFAASKPAVTWLRTQYRAACRPGVMAGTSAPGQSVGSGPVTSQAASADVWDTHH